MPSKGCRDNTSTFSGVDYRAISYKHNSQPRLTCFSVCGTIEKSALPLVGLKFMTLDQEPKSLIKQLAISGFGLHVHGS